MEDVKVVALNRALKILDAIKCTYAVIDFDGVKHGKLDVVPQKGKRKRGEHPHGEVRNYIRSFVGNLKPGDVGSVPADKYGLTYTMKNVSSFAVSAWGKKACMVTSSADKNVVEVLRIS